jgi:hypothetical protein
MHSATIKKNEGTTLFDWRDGYAETAFFVPGSSPGVVAKQRSYAKTASKQHYSQAGRQVKYFEKKRRFLLISSAREVSFTKRSGFESTLRMPLTAAFFSQEELSGAPGALFFCQFSKQLFLGLYTRRAAGCSYRRDSLLVSGG